MRSWLVAVVVSMGACGATAPLPAPAPALVPHPGVIAQLEALPDLDGTVVGHSDASATLVVVFASWCEHCRAELVELDAVRAHHVRILGVNYRGHEEYDHRGNSAAVRAFAQATPWLRVVPIDGAVFDALGRPPQIPTLYVFDAHGTLVETYDRRARKPPDRVELATVLQRIGA